MTLPSFPTRIRRGSKGPPLPHYAISLFALFAMLMVTVMVQLNRLSSLDVNCQRNSQHSGNCNEGGNQTPFLQEISYNKDRLKLPDKPWKFDYYGPDEAIQSYNPSNHPVLPEVRNVKVRLFTEVFNDQEVPMNECKHILYDGLTESSVVQFQGVTYTLNNKVQKNGITDDWKEDDLWVLDAHHLVNSCDIIIQLVEQTLKLKNDQKWTILGVDFGDAHDKINHCPGVEHVIGPDHYRVAKRSIGIGREWSEEDQFPTRGTIFAQPNPPDRPVLHLPYPVRTDVSRQVADFVRSKAGVANPSEVIHRPIDVSHFYQRQANVAIRAYYDNLRNGVNVVLKFLNNMPVLGRPIQTFAGLAGKDRKQGRNEASQAYADIMMQSKIIVVAQRDAWSDHYRLTEALSSGAMVLADETLVLPRGFRDGESLVIFTSFEDLREKLLYFLQHDEERLRIAKKGWEVVMGYHRSWHGIEAVIFGEPVTEKGDAMASFQRDLNPRVEPPPPSKRRKGRKPAQTQADE